jgi:outer membrane protein TolC
MIRFFVFLVIPILLHSESSFDETMRRYELRSSETLGSTQPIAKPNVLKLTISQAIDMVLENNLTVQNAKMEIAKSDSEEFKTRSKHTLKWVLGSTISQQKLPLNQNNFFSGTKIQLTRFSAGLEKYLESGTTFKLEAFSQRFDSNALENSLTTPASFSVLAIPPLYTSGFSTSVQQELLKNYFGEQDRNLRIISKKTTVIKREEWIPILSRLVTKILADYWNLSFFAKREEVLEKLIKNFQYIEKITNSKVKLGLSESYELNQIHTNLIRLESQLMNLKIEHSVAERDLKRILNVDTTSSIEGVTNLDTQVEIKSSLKEDVEFALQNRVDYLILKKQKEIIELNLANGILDDTPSVKASLNYTTLSQNLTSSTQDWLRTQSSFWSFAFPQISADVKLSYPLWDLEIKTKIRDLESQKVEVDLAIQKMEEQIEQEIADARDEIQATTNLLKNAQTQREEYQKFYNSVLTRYEQGRLNSTELKRALDALSQSDLVESQVIFQLNIQKLKYDLARNYVFQRYGINPFELLNMIVKRGEELQGSMYDSN